MDGSATKKNEGTDRKGAVEIEGLRTAPDEAPGALKRAEGAKAPAAAPTPGSVRMDIAAAHLARVAKGDQRALGALHKTYAATVMRTAFGVLHDQADADEAAQEAWLEVWRRAGQYEPHRGSVQAWLVMIARARALDRLKQRTRAAEKDLLAREAAEAEWAARRAEEARADRRAEQALLVRAVRTELARLPAPQQQAVRLQFWEGMTQTEIAARMGLSRQRVRTLLEQAIEELRRRLPRAGGDSG